MKYSGKVKQFYIFIIYKQTSLSRIPKINIIKLTNTKKYTKPPKNAKKEFKENPRHHRIRRLKIAKPILNNPIPAQSEHNFKQIKLPYKHFTIT